MASCTSGTRGSRPYDPSAPRLTASVPWSAQRTGGSWRYAARMAGSPYTVSRMGPPPSPSAGLNSAPNPRLRWLSAPTDPAWRLQAMLYEFGRLKTEPPTTRCQKADTAPGRLRLIARGAISRLPGRTEPYWSGTLPDLSSATFWSGTRGSHTRRPSAHCPGSWPPRDLMAPSGSGILRPASRCCH